MSEIVQQVIYDLLQFRRAPIEKTRIFGRLKHNEDLCPKFQNKIELILGAFRKYHQITYDIQGFGDRGSDVVVRQVVGEESKFICFQIKSDSDLSAPSLMMKLKAQNYETGNTYKELLDYYLVLCCNPLSDKTDKRGNYIIDKDKKNRMRSIAAEFTTARGTHVIEPEFALTFLQLSSVQIDAAIKSKLGSEDIVYRSALAIINDLTRRNEQPFSLLFL